MIRKAGWGLLRGVYGADPTLLRGRAPLAQVDTRAILLYVGERMPPVRLFARSLPGRRSPTRRVVDHATFG